MTSTTLAALRSSIAHWKRMQANRAETPESPITVDCALCCLFYTDSRSNDCCANCPVCLAVGQRFCTSTPYHAASLAFDRESESDWKEAAQAEIDFLNSLLPES